MRAGVRNTLPLRRRCEHDQWRGGNWNADKRCLVCYHSHSLVHEMPCLSGMVDSVVVTSGVG